VGTMVAGGVVASTIEGWTFIQGMYWAFQTTTTVGKPCLDFGSHEDDLIHFHIQKGKSIPALPMASCG